ncbi:hypothetical protein OR571_13645 [Psychrobacillus sp. NEAU-3TGS]|uniref:hypothetical protein n=1 Tax=Psychrobacillus sp. NEAU-3TGS TaxID=2995412 RepID=UPI002496ABE5|nr:hypothetical protein [Psychrobacillus sp. NEAU-3TGS]MDI2588131.1 hypothetical protein [Psychrobacillus sp. NEAU-3TGS]
MDIAKFIVQLQNCSKKEFKTILKGFDIKLSDKELDGVHPLLQEISLSWLVLGVPVSIQQKLIQLLGEQRATALYKEIIEKAPSSFR